MKKKIALFVGLMFAANISYADLKIGVINMNAVLEKTPQMENVLILSSVRVVSN